jgi:eukaryotic-like serine/threonine-protein kinase
VLKGSGENTDPQPFSPRIGRDMTGPSAARPDSILIADQFVVETNRKLASVHGLAAFGVIDRADGRTDLMAIQLDRNLPARPRELQALASPIDGLLTPVAYGSAGAACYVICPAPPGPSVQARGQPWSEAELLACVLRPAARVLEALAARGLTHRGIRLDNVFQSAPGQSVVLGPAWTAPPAMAQPVLFEPPYSAMCLPGGRGDGSIADDVYALGVLLLCLAMGRSPLEQHDERSIIQRKLELGSYASLVGDVRVPPIIGDLVRGMLAEDPEHRPAPALLLDPASARGRRLANRPPRRAQRSMVLAGAEVWDARSLAFALAVEPDQGVHSLRSGMVEHWLRRILGDVQLAIRVEELVHHRSPDRTPVGGSDDAELLMSAVALLDPLAPLCWRGVALWPDGIGPALAVAQPKAPEVLDRLQEIVTRQEVANWAGLRPDRCDAPMLRSDARRQQSWLRQLGKGVGASLLVYQLNPLMPCASPLLANHWVDRLADLLPALEDVAGNADRRQVEPVDMHIAAFIAARVEHRMQQELATELGGSTDCLAQIRILAQLQSRLGQRPLPALANWLASKAEPVVATWRNRDRRTAIEERLQGLAAAGYLAPMLQVLDDPSARNTDARQAQEAAAMVAAVEAELADIGSGAPGRAEAATRLGQEIAAGFGLAAMAAALVIAALG